MILMKFNKSVYRRRLNISRSNNYVFSNPNSCNSHQGSQ